MSRPCTKNYSASAMSSSRTDRAASGERALRDCAFCREVGSGEVIDQLGTVAALHDRYPISEGHALIIPVRHVVDLFELSDEELLDAWRLLHLLRGRFRELDPAIEGFNVGANVGGVAGQTIPHAHIHLIPRRTGDTPDPRGGVRGVIPEQMSY